MVPGLGQLYKGQPGRAAWMFVAYLAAWMIGVWALNDTSGENGLSAVLVAIVFLGGAVALWVYNVWDAVRNQDADAGWWRRGSVRR